MQIMTLAIQNAVDPRELDTATSSATFFRSLGSSLGGAVFGTVLTTRLAHHLQEVIASGAGQVNISSIQSGASLGNLPPGVAHTVLEAFSARSRICLC